MDYFYVAFGGALGSVLRFFIGHYFRFPGGTFCVNTLGSLLIGVFFVLFTQRFDERLGLFLMTGVLGGFTTFSAFSLDLFRLLEEERFVFALLYLLATVFGSLLMLLVGIILTRSAVS